MAKKHRGHDDEEHMDETWLIPYADLLTLLLALFIVLFASSQIDQKKFDEISRALSGAFSGGFNFFDNSNTVPINDELMDKDVKKEKNEETEIDTEPPDTPEDRLKEWQEKTLQQLEKFEQESTSLEDLKRKLDEYIEENGLTTQLETKLDHEQLMITIRDNALFDSGSATVKDDAKVLAVAVGNMIEQYPQYQINIAGHTDNNPINTAEFPSNWYLSSKRALNFMVILLEEDSSSPGRYSAIGHGEYRPISLNITNQGRAENRRVEVSILRNYIIPTVFE